MSAASTFNRAAELVARQLASFRLGLDADDPYAYTEYEWLCTGHIVGNLWANDLLRIESIADVRDTPEHHLAYVRERLQKI